MAMQQEINNQQLYDIYEQLHVPFWQTPLFYSVVAIICLTMIIAFVYWLKKRNKATHIQLAPWDEALESLNSLKNNNIATAAQGKQFYIELTSLLKKYVYRRYNFDKHEILSSTDQEFIAYLDKNGFPAQLRDILQAICMGSMVVKFANVQAIGEQIEIDLALAHSFIKTTQPSF